MKQFLIKTTLSIAVCVSMNLRADLPPTDENGEFVVDAVVAVVFGMEGTQVVTKTDVDRPNLGGQWRPLDDIVFERLLYLDAQKHKAMDDDSVDRYLAVVQRQNNLTSEQMRQVFASAGYTYEEGREQFKIMQAANSMIDHKVRSGALVTRKQIEEYHKNNPEYEEAEYTLQRAFVPFDESQDREHQKDRLAIDVPLGRGVENIEWTAPFKVGASELANDKDFVHSMKVGQIRGPIATEEGFEFFRLIDKKEERERTLEERHQEIVEKLREPKYRESLDKYRESLVEGASVLKIGEDA